jgi:hypothetical protein
MPIGGNNSYPSLNTIANLARSKVNDDKPGATGTPGEGQILTNSSVTLQNFMNSAIRDVYRDTRIMGQPTLIADNYILYNLPPINSPLGPGVMNPAVQVALQFTGYFDGLLNWPNFTLPAGLLYPMEMWERASTGTASSMSFSPMKQASGALPPRQQVQVLGEWEWRQDGIWMNGATQYRDVRLRYLFTFADLVSSTIDWDATFVPILDCQEAVADKIAVLYSARLGGTALADAKMDAKNSILKLRQQITRDRQMIDFTRPAYGDGRAGRAGNPAETALY